jgi:hypothetical protein
MWSIANRAVLLESADPVDLGDMKENIAIKNTEKGYDFEMRIPWSILNQTVQPGQRVRWEMAANNSKVIGPSEQQVILQTAGRYGYNNNVSAWYRAFLMPKP